MRRKLFPSVICLTLIILLVAGCGTPAITPALTTETLTPTSTLLPEPTSTITPVPSTATSLEQAVSALRRVDYDNLDDAQAEMVNQAVETIISEGPEGIRLLKQELAAIEQAGEKDVSFQLMAAWLFWDIGNLDEVEAIVEIWSAVPMENWNYRMLFLPAIQAASTQDPRALPMLKVLLSDNKGSVFFGEHYLTLEFPLTHEFLWGAYGSKGLPVLYEVLQTSKDPAAMESAINLLSRAQYLLALPQIRKAVNSEYPEVRSAAIRALGLFGHPDDYDLLIAGLDSPDAEELYTYVYAINEFGDTRATPHMIPLLKSDNKQVREEVAWGLGNYIASPEGLIALMDIAASTTDQDWAKSCKSYVNKILDGAGLTWEKYKSLPKKEQDDVTETFRYSENTLKPGEEAITHDQLLEVVAEWRDTGHISSEKWAWVETRHVLPIAMADDIDLLLDGKSGFYLRLSDECIYEVRIVDELIKWIGRSRYR